MKRRREEPDSATTVEAVKRQRQTQEQTRVPEPAFPSLGAVLLTRCDFCERRGPIEEFEQASWDVNRRPVPIWVMCKDDACRAMVEPSKKAFEEGIDALVDFGLEGAAYNVPRSTKQASLSRIQGSDMSAYLTTYTHDDPPSAGMVVHWRENGKIEEETRFYEIMHKCIRLPAFERANPHLPRIRLDPAEVAKRSPAFQKAFAPYVDPEFDVSSSSSVVRADLGPVKTVPDPSATGSNDADDNEDDDNEAAIAETAASIS